MTISLRISRFTRRHPILAQSFLWAIPALVIGLILRTLFLSYLPYAFWGADSRSYFSFAHRLLIDHEISLDAKRRYLYPILMLPVAVLPGATLRWLALLQHAFGLLSLLPLAYLVRKTTAAWRLWIIPVTVLYSMLPIVVWHEHELLGEFLFINALLWAFAGWVAWAGEVRVERARHLFWWFFVPFAVFSLTKPSGRFAWPGLVAGLLMVSAWRVLTWRHWAALGALALATLTMGPMKQGAWLLYTATFPLTQLGTPLHAEYKAEIADMVKASNERLDLYYQRDGVPFTFLENPARAPDRRLWAALANDRAKQTRIYLDLATEGIRARPLTFLYLGLQRAIVSSSLSYFRLDRFTGDYYRKRTEHYYADAQQSKTSPVRLAYGLGNGPLPSYGEFAPQLERHPGSWMSRVVQRWMGVIDNALDFQRIPKFPRDERTLSRSRPTLLGCWLMAAMLVAFLPAYRRSYGVWVLVLCTYVWGVFLVSQANPRYFAPAWTILIPLLALPADALVRVWKNRKGSEA